MVIEKADVEAVRLCERRGMFANDMELTENGLTREEYVKRLRQLSAGGLIRSLQATLMVPALQGGDWVWAGMLATAKSPLGVANALKRSLSYVTETIFNLGLPDKLGPNLALLFFSRNFETDVEVIRSTSGIEYCEIYRVANLSFPVAVPISSEERALLREVVRSPASDLASLAAGIGRDPLWVQTKLDRLLWTESNHSGLVRIQPELDWSRADNFGHFHFLLETGLQPKELFASVAEHRLSLVLEGKPYRERYVQVEADLWGIAELMEKVSHLNQIPGVRVAGVVWNHLILLNTEWTTRLLD